MAEKSIRAKDEIRFALVESDKRSVSTSLDESRVDFGGKR